MQEEDHHHHLHNNMVIKRRRTKRPRPTSPLALTMATSSSSTVEFDSHVAMNSSSSPSNSGIEFTKNSVDQEEEEDMANCLILLAQGHNNNNNHQRLSSSSNMDVYQCKTCNRSFPSFQALGGHRASHKKPKLEDNKLITDQQGDKCLILNNEDHVTTLSLQIPSHNNNNNTTTTITTTSNNNNNSNNNVVKKNRVHECSICGAEFSSGQALGGHMRRHRPLPSSTTAGANGTSHEEPSNMTKNLLSLDLNLPAPEDDHRQENKFTFASKEQVIVFSASSLVDCHY